MEKDVARLIDLLVNYGREKLDLCLEDAVYARNQLGELFGVVMGDMRKETPEDVQTVIDALTEEGKRLGLTEDGAEMRFEAKLFGYVTASPGYVRRSFMRRKMSTGIESATEYLYQLCIDNRYIRMADIRKNILWYADGPKGKIGVTINLSKPEKDNKQVAAERNATQNKYPKCMLCLENLGFPGTATHPARQTLRIVPIDLAGEHWHMQYSPYSYYPEHIIVFSDEHRPMAVTPTTFVRLLDFVELLPHYFLGSNADLPIVGGSILSHDHYQGGSKVLPMLHAPVRKTYRVEKGFKISVKDWYNSVVSVTGPSKSKVALACAKILALWRSYTDAEVGVYSHTGDFPHNTITPIAMVDADGNYNVDLILRNNRTDEAHPDGIFHPTKDMHHIKKEGIGLIEAMGMFILPGRLKRELGAAEQILTAGQEPDYAALREDPAVGKHADMIRQIGEKYGYSLSADEAHKRVKEAVNEVCLNILECTAVFKNDEKGAAAFERFMAQVVEVCKLSRASKNI